GSYICFFFSSRRRHTRSKRDWSSDVCSSDLGRVVAPGAQRGDERFVRGTPFIQGFTRGVNGHLGASQFLAIGGNRRGGFKFIQRSEERSCRERVKKSVDGGSAT